MSLSFFNFLIRAARLTSLPCFPLFIAVSLRWEQVTVGVTGSLGLHYMAAWTGGGERPTRWAINEDWLGDPSRPRAFLHRFTEGPQGAGGAHLDQVRFAMKKGIGCTFTEKAGVDSSHSAQEVTQRPCLRHTHNTLTCTYIYLQIHTHSVCQGYYSKFRLLSMSTQREENRANSEITFLSLNNEH